MGTPFATFPTTPRSRQFLLHPHRALPRHSLPCRHPPGRIIIVAVGNADQNPRVESEISSVPPPCVPSQAQVKRHIGRSIASEKDRTKLPDSPAPRNSTSLAASLCSAWEDMINRWLEPPPLRPSIDPEKVLAGNFAPVPELPPTPCLVVSGSIPAALRGGAYIRNGPNPQHQPRGPHHLFDGDGMLHSLLLPADSGRSPAVLCSRFVRTHKYAVENEAGGPVFPSLFTLRGLAGVARSAVAVARIVTGQMNPREGISSANISLACFHDRLFALGEPDLPYVVRLSPDDGDISTLGRSNFDGRLYGGMAAHPKKDPDTGEIFGFRYRPVPPFLTYFRFDEDGRKQPDVPIFSIPRPSFFHDFAITKRNAIFPDIQLVVDPLGMALGGGGMFRFDPKKLSRMGVMPRRAASGRDMRWFDVPGFNPLHILNAWEEEGEDGDARAVVLVASNALNIDHLLERMELVHSCVEMVRIDLMNNVVTRTPLSVKALEVGVINPAYVGKKSRYSYLAVAGPLPKFSGVAKLDFELATENKDCVMACREYGPGCFGGEPCFVARDGAKDEDDGYVVTYVHDENSGESRFVVMDAKSPELAVVAEVLLPRRVPYGFHGVFVRESDLRNQRL